VLSMTRAEQILLIGVLLVPLVLLTRGVTLRRRLGWALSATAVAAAVVLPWAAYNTARFHRPVLIGTEFGVTVAVSNCRPTYWGPHLGFQDSRCSDAAVASGRITGRNAAARDSDFLRVGLQYARDHLSRVPVVLVAREARTWSIPLVNQSRLDVGRGTSYRVVELGFAMYWVLLPAAVVGAVILRRRVTLLPLLALAVTVSIGTALTYGFTRFRAAADVAVVLLAATTIDAVLRRLRRPASSLRA
jgi:hypothetical protein